MLYFPSFLVITEIKKQLREQNQDADDRDIFKHYILPHFEIGFDELQSTVNSGDVMLLCGVVELGDVMLLCGGSGGGLLEGPSYSLLLFLFPLIIFYSLSFSLIPPIPLIPIPSTTLRSQPSLFPPAKIFSSFDVEECEVEDAVLYYIRAGNKDLKKISDDIRFMYNNFGGKKILWFCVIVCVSACQCLSVWVCVSVCLPLVELSHGAFLTVSPLLITPPLPPPLPFSLYLPPPSPLPPPFLIISPLPFS